MTLVRWMSRFCSIAFVITTPLCAAVITVDMDDPNAWTVVQDEDTSVEFGFDYSALGIPEAPNGSDTSGARLAANESLGQEATISISPKNVPVAGTYTVTVDMWLNYYADPGKSGTTEFGGLYVGFDASASDPRNGAGFVTNTDGDTSDDYRLYKDDRFQLIDTGQYDLFSLSNADPDLADAFPGEPVPEKQLDFDFFDPTNEDVIAEDGTLAFGWHTIQAVVDADGGTASFTVDDVEIGTVDATIDDAPVQLDGGVALTMWDIFPSVSPVPEFAFAVFDNLVVDVDREIPDGDFDGDGLLTEADINLLSGEIQSGGMDPQYDLNGDNAVTTADHEVWVKDLKRTWFGDANLDGEFNSTDFVRTFQIGHYEDGIPTNSGWGEGDWNADAEFDTTDFVRAFQDGGFELGPVPATAVPEPSCATLTVLAGLGLLAVRRRRSA